MNNLFDLSGKTALVTGASKGIGEMIATGLLQSGVKTYICSRKEDELFDTQKKLSEYGQCLAICADLSTYEGVAALASKIKESEPKLSILINNAGATWGASLEDFPETGWDKVMNLNVKSLFYLTTALLPSMRLAATSDDPARVVNVGSINGLSYSALQNYSYSASKAAVHHLSKQMAVDLAKDHINVNVIAPGFFPSKMTAHLLDDVEQMLEHIPRRRLGQLEDVAGTVIYLCSRASSFVTGDIVVLDGGQSLLGKS